MRPMRPQDRNAIKQRVHRVQRWLFGGFRNHRRLGWWLLSFYGVAAGATCAYTGPRAVGAQPQPQAPRGAPQIANPHGDLAAACEACHTAESWTLMRQPLSFNHDTTGFRRRGAHARAECRACHTSLVFGHVGTSCADCHRDVHEGRRGLRCQDCHGDDRWVNRGEALRAHANTRFPLEGMHALVDCSRCHDGIGEASITSLSVECASCHAQEFAATRSPDHVAAGYSTRCELCHDVTTVIWSGGTFDHAARGFPLTGAHALISCVDCHLEGNFADARADCNSCHSEDYMATTNPNHQQAGFPTECSVCHGTVSWVAANFDHDRTSFPLRGRHTTVACAQCHIAGTFAKTPRECYACHQPDYDNTTSPNHRAAGFSTDCASCHTSAAWQPASFDHDALFRINSGKHAGKWADCSTCHKDPASYANFDCLGCHEHERVPMDDKHQNVGGYRYESSGCYECHPDV